MHFIHIACALIPREKKIERSQERLFLHSAKPHFFIV